MDYINKISSKRKIFGCIILFFISFICCFSIKILSCSISSKSVQENIEKSMNQINRAGLYPALPLLGANDDWEYNAYGQIDFFTELITINSAYTIDSDHYIIEAMRNPYGAKSGIDYNPNLNLNSSINNESDITIDILSKYRDNLICIVFDGVLYQELSNIYSDIYIGVSNKNDENDARRVTNNIVFVNKTLYLEVFI